MVEVCLPQQSNLLYTILAARFEKDRFIRAFNLTFWELELNLTQTKFNSLKLCLQGVVVGLLLHDPIYILEAVWYFKCWYWILKCKVIFVI